MEMPRSWSHRTLVSPERNHRSSPLTGFIATNFVVILGKPSAKSKRIWRPNAEIVPVPVRSAFRVPCSRTSASRSS
jgi:hypothetical protein